jgi:hypothetical protein
MLVLHNTFVPAPMTGHSDPANGQPASVAALNQNHGEFTARDFKVMNNLFIGRPGSSFTVFWWSNFENGLFNYNGYYPDGKFRFGVTGSTQTSLENLKALTGILEDQGLIVPSNVFQNLAAAPSSYVPEITPAGADVRLNAGVNAAVDAASSFSNVNDVFLGDKADLGALERDCSTAPSYGPRATGIDETNQANGCEGWSPTGCPGEVNGPAPQCGAAPVSGCRTPTTASLLLKRAPLIGDHNYVKFRWRYGSSPVGDFGNPLTVAKYSMCIYQTPPSGPASLILSAVAPAGTQGCGAVCSSTKPCWRASPTSAPIKWTYKDSSNSPDGLNLMKLVSSSVGKAKVDVRGRSDCLGLPASLNFQTPIKVQVVNSATTGCWEAVFDPVNASANDTRYSAKFDVRFTP